MTRIREFIGSNILFAYILSVLITYQFYFPVIGNKNLTVFIVLAVVLGLLSFKNEYLEIRAYQIYYYCIFLVFIYISFLYSTDKIDALKHLIYLSLPLPIYYYFKIFSADKIKVLKVFVFSALPYLLGVFLLFLFEKYELAILNSGIMKIFIEPDTLLDLARNFSNYNIWETKRIGGFFVNAQIGALFAGFNLFVVAWLYAAEKKKRYIGIAIPWLVSMVFYASRTGFLALAGTICFTAGIWVYNKYGFKKISRLAVSLSVIFLFMLTMMFVNPRTKNFGSNLNSINGRTEIWKASIGVIKDNWLLGVGLDGETWAKKYNIYAESINARKDTPPHNMFLEIWGKSGIFAVLFFVLFLISCLYKNTKMFIQTGDYYFLLVTAFLSFAAIFAFVENMFLMDIRILAIIWMVLGLNPEDKSDKYQGKYYERI